MLCEGKGGDLEGQGVLEMRAERAVWRRKKRVKGAGER